LGECLEVCRNSIEVALEGAGTIFCKGCGVFANCNICPSSPKSACLGYGFPSAPVCLEHSLRMHCSFWLQHCFSACVSEQLLQRLVGDMLSRLTGSLHQTSLHVALPPATQPCAYRRRKTTQTASQTGLAGPHASQLHDFGASLNSGVDTTPAGVPIRIPPHRRTSIFLSTP
jgi:hypothetical protein